MLGYINRCPNIKGASQETLVLKALPTRAGDARDASSISGLERSPGGEGMATHSSILAWRIPQSEEPGKLQSMGSQRVNMTE